MMLRSSHISLRLDCLKRRSVSSIEDVETVPCPLQAQVGAYYTNVGIPLSGSFLSRSV